MRQALNIILEHVSRVVTVSEQQIADAVRSYFSDTHHVIEGAGASNAGGIDQGERTHVGNAGRRHRFGWKY